MFYWVKMYILLVFIHNSKTNLSKLFNIQKTAD